MAKAQHRHHSGGLHQDRAVHCNGRVVSHYGRQSEVESIVPGGGDGESAKAAIGAVNAKEAKEAKKTKEKQGTLYRCHQRANVPPVVTGDLVQWEPCGPGGDEGVILARGPRRNVFGRGDRPTAANIDMVLVMAAVAPLASNILMDRYLVAVENLGLHPILVVNKADMLNGDTSQIKDMLSLYRSLGYPVHLISARDGRGLARLRRQLKGLTAVLVGQSGVGKSSLINALAVRRRSLPWRGFLSKRASAAPSPEPVATGPLSAVRGEGVHTTSAARLHHLSGFDLIDSPGIREFNLGHVKAADVLHGFVEFRPFLGGCKYRDCSHRREPDCALQQALQRGKLRQERFDSCFRILQECAG